MIKCIQRIAAFVSDEIQEMFICRHTGESVSGYERLRDKLSVHELDGMMSASGHRRAEFRHKQLWDKSTSQCLKKSLALYVSAIINFYL